MLLINKAQHKKISFSNIQLDVEPVFLKLDHKDVDLLYYLSTKKASELSKIFAQAAEVESSPKEKVLESKPAPEPVLASCDYKTTVFNLKVDVKSLVLSYSDGDYENFVGEETSTLPVPLIEFCISELIVDQRNCKVTDKGNNPFMAMTMIEFIERYTTLKAILPPFNNLKVSVKLYATYFNQMSQAFEPFIEPWSLDVTMKQNEADSIQDLKIFSGDFMNLNVSYGLAFNIMDLKTRILEKVAKID